jgi:hypothetical protein
MEVAMKKERRLEAIKTAKMILTDIGAHDHFGAKLDWAAQSLQDGRDDAPEALRQLVTVSGVLIQALGTLVKECNYQQDEIEYMRRFERFGILAGKPSGADAGRGKDDPGHEENS